MQQISASVNQNDRETSLGDLMEVTGISKIRRFTPKGIEVVHLRKKEIGREDVVVVEIRYWPYMYPWNHSGIMNREAIFTSELKFRNLFDETLERFYKLFKE